jgi:anti-sigma factor RsiW
MAVKVVVAGDDPANPQEAHVATQEEIQACQASIEETKASLQTILDRLDAMPKDTADPKTLEQLQRQVQRTRHSLAQQTATLRSFRRQPSGKGAGQKGSPAGPGKPEPKLTALGLPVL